MEEVQTMSSSEPLDTALTVDEVEAQIRAMSGADWARAFSLARLCAVGLDGWTSESLLAEALVKLRSAVRVWRRGVHPLVTLKVAMRSIASNLRKQQKNAPIDRYTTVDVGAGQSSDDGDPDGVVARDDRTPYHIVEKRSQLVFLENLVKGDEDVQLVLEAWADGLRGNEATQALGFDMKRYDAARNRLNRHLRAVSKMEKNI